MIQIERYFRDGKGSYSLGYAYSFDLNEWVRDDERVGIVRSKQGWDSEMMCYPSACKIDDNFHLIYNGNSFGKHGFGLAILEQATKYKTC